MLLKVRHLSLRMRKGNTTRHFLQHAKVTVLTPLAPHRSIVSLGQSMLLHFQFTRKTPDLSFLFALKSLPHPLKNSQDGNPKGSMFSPQGAFILSVMLLVEEKGHVDTFDCMTAELEAEHVLKNSSSFASRNSLRQENARNEPPQFGRLQNGRLGNVKYSPTPSIKRGKAERLLKEHGSPPGLRVTAGGKIVPSDISPLCSPRFGFNQPNKQGFVNINPFDGHTVVPTPVMPGRPMPASAAIPFGSFVGFTPDGQYVPLMAVPCGGLPTYVNHEQFTQAPASWSAGSGAPVASVSQPSIGVTPPPGFAPHAGALTSGQQMQALEREQAKLNEEYRNVDQAGVIHQGVLNAAQRAALVTRKISLTNRLDEIRVSLKKLKTSEEARTNITPPEKVQPVFGQPLPKAPRPSFAQPQMPMFNQPPTAAGPFGNFQYFQLPQQYPVPQNQAEGPSEVTDIYSASSLAPNGSQNNFRQLSTSTPGLGAEATTVPSSSLDRAGLIEQHAGRSPASTQISHEPRRSHAVAIKNPQESTKQGVHSQKSSLDPTRYVNHSEYDPSAFTHYISPSYKPMSQTQGSTFLSTMVSRESESPPRPREVLGKDYDWPIGMKDDQNGTDYDGSKGSELDHKPSLSSVSTADFFPNNPLEHSTKDIRSRETSDSGLLAPPVTPNRASPGPLTRHVDRRSSEAPASPAPNSFRMSSWNAACDPISDRIENNTSPKAHFSGSPPDQSHFGETACRKISTIIPTIRAVPDEDHDSVKPRGFSDSYREGYRAGLHRLPLGKDEFGDILEGYIAGLQQFADMHAASRASHLQATEDGAGNTRDDPQQDQTQPSMAVELKENSASSTINQIKQEADQTNARAASAQFGAPLTRQYTGNQIQSLQRDEKADKPESAMETVPARTTSLGQGMRSPGGSLGENRSHNISLPVNNRYQRASFNWRQGLPQHDGPSDHAISGASREVSPTEALRQVPNDPIYYEAERAPTPPPKNSGSATKCVPWQARSPKSSPSKSSRSPTKSRLDRLASQLGVKKTEPTIGHDEGNLGSPDSGPNSTPERKKKREEFKRFLSRPKGEQAHELKPVHKDRGYNS